VIALLGATGYTGKLVVAELVRRGLPHRLGGRNPEKLASLPSDADRFVLDAGESGRLDTFLDGATAVISTVGPFIRLGMPAVEAAARNHVAYVDSTGEQAFVSEVYERFADAPVPIVPGCGFDFVPGDLAEEAQCARLIDTAAREFGRIDLLVNNAAFQGKQVENFEQIDSQRLRRTFAVNIEAMFHLVRHALPWMKSGSAIINTASVQAYHPSAAILDYATTKGAIVAFTKGLAQHLIERGIRVNCVAPGPVWTPLVVASFHEEKNAQFGKGYPMERPAQPAELAPSYVFLASDESRYVVGEVLGVTGGKPLG